MSLSCSLNVWLPRNQIEITYAGLYTDFSFYLNSVILAYPPVQPLPSCEEHQLAPPPPTHTRQSLSGLFSSTDSPTVDLIYQNASRRHLGESLEHLSLTYDASPHLLSLPVPSVLPPGSPPVLLPTHDSIWNKSICQMFKCQTH